MELIDAGRPSGRLRPRRDRAGGPVAVWSAAASRKEESTMSTRPSNRRTGRCAVRLALAATLSAAAVPALAAADVALLDAARKAQPTVVESLKDMVMIESGSANAEGLAKMADY